MKPASSPRCASWKRAGEAMENAAESGGTPDFFEELQAIGPGVAAVNDDGEFGFASEHHLLAKDSVLRFAWRMIVEIIETDFAPGDHLGMFCQCGELSKCSGVACLAS